MLLSNAFRNFHTTISTARSAKFQLAIVTVLLFLQAVLAAIVLVSLKGLFKQFIVLKYLWKISKIDAVSDATISFQNIYLCSKHSMINNDKKEK